MSLCSCFHLDPPEGTFTTDAALLLEGPGHPEASRARTLVPQAQTMKVTAELLCLML